MSRTTERQLARYFFDIKSSTGNVSDVEGSELRSVAEALLEAEHCARDLLARAIIADTEPPTEIVVHDENRQVMGRLDMRVLIRMSCDDIM